MQTFKPIKKRIGDLLVETNLITNEQLSNALELQNKKGIKLGHALLELNYLTEDLLLAFLGRQCGISYVSLKEFGEITPEALRSIPEELVRKYEVFPLKLKDNELVVAVSDPFNVFAIDDLRLITGYEIKTVITSAHEIKSHIEKYYLEDIPSQLKKFPKNLLFEVVSYGIDIGASEIYLSDNTLRYFFNQRYLKTLRLDEKNKVELISTIYKLSGETTLTYESHFTKNPQHTIRVQNFGDVLVIKIKETPPKDISISNLGFEPNDSIIYQKHLNATYGMIVISAAPGDGKTTTLEATANWLSSNQNVVYYQPGTHRPQTPFLIFTNSALEHQSPANYILIDDISDAHLNAAITRSQNSCVICTTTNEQPKINSPMLYIRQKLVRKLCSTCKRNYVVSKEYINNFIGTEITSNTLNEEVILSRWQGCKTCNFTGYEAKLPVFFFSTQPEEITPQKAKNGLLKAIWNKVKSGEVSVEEIIFYK